MLRLSMLLLMGTVLFFSSCKDDDDPTPENEEELITTMTVVLAPDGGGSTATLLFRDLDGDGGNAPTITTDKLAPNTTYTGTISLLNETETPAENITEEVKEEGDEHQFFYATTMGLNISFAYNDQDADGRPIGLDFTLVTGDASTGTLRITLRHEPDKAATNVSMGDITNAGGETDIEVDFDVTIE